MSKSQKPQTVKAPKNGLSGMSLGGFSRLSVARKVILTAATMATLILVALAHQSIRTPRARGDGARQPAPSSTA